MRKSFYATKKKGNLLILDRNAFDMYIAALKDDTPLEISIAEISKTRSLNQNNYYFGVVVKAISDKTGMFPDEVHEFLKAKFLRKEFMYQGKVFEYAGSTAGLDTKAFEEYLENCRIFAARDIEVFIPLPNE